MIGAATSRLMADGRRLHLQHGPIDIVIEAFGATKEIEASYRQGVEAFGSVLGDLAQDLDILRQPVDPDKIPDLGPLSMTLWKAAQPFAAGQFITPMAAVAGAVADYIKSAMLDGRSLEKLYVNNGGDIAVHLAKGYQFVSGIVDNQDMPAINGKITLRAEDNIAGIATSGWRGRSLSPGIADAVTVLASSAAIADVAATIIAGNVVVNSPAVTQRPANELRDDTDLRGMLVTSDVGILSNDEKRIALEQGMKIAQKLIDTGLIHSVYFALQGETCSVQSDCEIEIRKIA